MKNLLIVLLVVCLNISGCNSYDKPVSDASIADREKETGFYDILSEEQINYLKEYTWGTYEVFDEERFIEEYNSMTYEGLNRILLGSGLELYNQSDGIDVYGLTYEYDDFVDKSLYGKYYKDVQCTSEKKITLEEAYAIRDKGENMRVTDFLKYNFYMENIEEHINWVYLPLEGLEEKFIKIRIEESIEGTIHISIPVYGGYGTAYSLLYDRDMINMSIKYEGSKEPYAILQGGTITNKSLRLKVVNADRNTEYIIDESRKLYKKMDDNSFEELTEYAYESEEIFVEKGGVSFAIEFATDDNPLPPGTYKLEFGKDKEGYIYKEIEFIIK